MGSILDYAVMKAERLQDKMYSCTVSHRFSELVCLNYISGNVPSEDEMAEAISKFDTCMHDRAKVILESIKDKITGTGKHYFKLTLFDSKINVTSYFLGEYISNSINLDTRFLTDDAIGIAVNKFIENNITHE